jgi:mannose-6-phosphate isomerase-like protein (cupin superfamily)
MTTLPSGASAARAFVLAPDEAPAYWFAGTYWRLLADGAATDGRSCTFDELCPRGLVAPLHVHDDAEEAFFVLEGQFVFTVGDRDVEAGPGSFVYLPPGVRHGFRVETDVGRVYNMLCPAGFERGIVDGGTPAPRIAMPPPGTSSSAVWDAQLRPNRPPAPWETGADPASWTAD